MKIIKKIYQGKSTVNKYLVDIDGKLYVLRYYNKKFFDGRIKAFNNIQILYENGVHVPKIYDYGEKNGYCFAIIEYISGTSLDKIDISPTLIEKVSNELYKMHNIKVPNIDLKNNYLKSIDRKITRLKKYNINIDLEKSISFIKDNVEMLDNLNTSIIHGDFHPGNIIFNEDNIYFIDLDVCKRDFAWSDFVSSINNKYFYKSVINTYFKGQIPENFEKIYELYKIKCDLEYIIYSKWYEEENNNEKIRKI